MVLTEYKLIIEESRLVCECTDPNYKGLSRFNGAVNERYLEATTTRESLASNPVLGDLAEYKNIDIPNPTFNPRTDSQTTKNMIEKRKMRERTNITLPEDIVSFMRYKIAEKEGTGVQLSDKSLDDLFNK